MSTSPTDLEARLKALEVKAKAEESKVWTWLKTNWLHFLTQAGVAYSILKHL